MYRWTPEMVRYMRDAAETGSYYEELAEKILPYLNREDHVCDAGCGLGYLAAALSPHVSRVTAVDISGDALEVLREKQLSNIEICCGDVAAMPPEKPYDAMVFCFFGSIDEVLKIAAAQCREKVFLITRNYETHRFSQEPHKSGRSGFSHAREVLQEKAIPFEEQTFDVEFGQPFRSWEDAWRFFELYSRDGVSEESLRCRLTAGRGEFPWYLPHRRKIALLHFSAENIREKME